MNTQNLELWLNAANIAWEAKWFELCEADSQVDATGNPPQSPLQTGTPDPSWECWAIIILLPSERVALLQMGMPPPGDLPTTTNRQILANDWIECASRWDQHYSTTDIPGFPVDSECNSIYLRSHSCLSFLPCLTPLSSLPFYREHLQPNESFDSLRPHIKFCFQGTQSRNHHTEVILQKIKFMHYHLTVDIVFFPN